MYTKNYDRGSSSSRPPFKRAGTSTGGSRFGGGSSSGGYRGSRSGGRSGGNGGRFSGQRIDPSRFINKAVVGEVAVAFVPVHTFADFPVDPKLKENIITKGYVLPTPIQDQAIPHLLKGLDVVGIANTGTGKTAAFLIPLIHKVLTHPQEKVIIVVPTRELAIQIEQEFKGFTKYMKLFATCCVGGAYIGRQITELRQQPSFVIGTPGRLKDLIERGFIKLPEFKTIVLDEADRMLGMGFVNDMKYMMAKMPKERHTLFFSATITPDIEALIKDFLHNPVRVSVKTGDTAKNVDQDIVRVRGSDKMAILGDLLKKDEFKKVIIFGKTKHGVERLSKTLVAQGFKVESIHGNKNHSKRQQALGQFKDGRIQALIATDVAARGLDIADVSHVINYDVPATYEDYVHRIGRTGRGNKKGTALTFIE